MQLPAREALLIRFDKVMYKQPAKWSDKVTLRTCAQAKGAIRLVESGCWFKYERIEHDPLSVREVRFCMGDFLKKTVAVIDAFHKDNFAHMDIRLENICYDSDGNPVFIDLDRSMKFTDMRDGVLLEGSVMYDEKLDATQHTWLQLGLVLWWALTADKQLAEGKNYHTQANKVDGTVQPLFVVKLLEGMQCVSESCLIGTFTFIGHLDTKLMEEFLEECGGNKTIKQVLEERV